MNDKTVSLFLCLYNPPITHFIVILKHKMFLCQFSI